MQHHTGCSSDETENLKARIRQLESALKQQEMACETLKHYEKVFFHLKHEVHIWQLERNEHHGIKTWRLLDANPAALQNWGKQRSDVIGKLTDDIFQTNATEQFMPIVQNIFTQQQPYCWEDYFAATDQYLSMTSIPLNNAFVSVGIDVSDIRRRERDHKETILQLREAIAAGNIGLWNWDLITNETQFSPEWKAQLGYQDHEISNHFQEWQSRVHPDDLPNALKQVQATIDERRDGHESEFRMRHKDGSYRWLMAHASLMLDDNGVPIRMLGSHIDITKQKQMEETMLQQHKMEALGTLASGIAHDFNNLMTPMLGYVQLLQMELTQNIKVQRYTEQIETSILRAKELVQQVLFVSQSSPAKMLKVEPVYLNKVVNEVLSLLKTSANKNVSIKVDSADNLPAIGANATQIYRVILNLCQNAIQAMPTGGELHISLSQCSYSPLAPELPSKDDCVCMQISDTGMGMSEETQKRIFEPFFTTKDKGAERGTGLGLAIVSTVMQQLGGDIAVSSKKNAGSTFTLYFPIIPLGYASAPRQESIVTTNTIHHILFVDDEIPLCELATEILHKLGYEVTTCEKPKHALQLLQSHPNRYQLIMSDYSMPEMSGEDFIKQVRRLHPALPIVMVTGFSDMANSETCKSWGCDAIVAKPYKIAEIKAAIALSQQRSEQL